MKVYYTCQYCGHIHPDQLSKPECCDMCAAVRLRQGIEKLPRIDYEDVDERMTEDD